MRTIALTTTALLLALGVSACGDDGAGPGSGGGSSEVDRSAGGASSAGGAGASELSWSAEDRPPGSLDLDPLSAAPLPYLSCSATPETAASAPDGGAVVSSASFGSYSKNDVFTGTLSDVPVSGQEFDVAKRYQIDGTPENPWNAQINKSTTAAIEQGDVLLGEVWARCEKTLEESNECQMTFMVEDKTTYSKAIEYPVRVGKDWTHFYIPLEAPQAYAADGANVGLFAGYPDQTVEVGRLDLLNYGSSLTLDEMPQTAVSYPGIDASAAWRVPAGERIDQVRRDEFRVLVTDASGQAVEGASVQIKMLEHEFLFGSAISAQIVANGDEPAHYERYAKEVGRLFNLASPYNAFKWKPWEGDWGANWSQQVAQDSLDWIQGRDLTFRGHVLVWPSWRHLPTELETLYGSGPLSVQQQGELAQTVLDHIDEAMALSKGRARQWDVMNEPFDNHDLMDLLGDEIVVDWFERARQGDPDVELYINDYAILTGGPGETAHRLDYETWIRLLVERGAPLDGVGLQSHFGLSLTGPEDVYALLDRYGTSFDKDLAITEYDINVEDENLAACFTHDFMTTVFSHPHSTAFQLWGFWGDEDPIFNTDWTKKLAGRVWEDLVFQRWWTDESVASSADGEAQTRAFHGRYEVTATLGERSARAEVQHSRANPADVKLQLD